MLLPPCSLASPRCWGAPKTPQTPREKGAHAGNQPWKGGGRRAGIGTRMESSGEWEWPRKRHLVRPPLSESSGLGGSKSVCAPPNPPSDPRAGLGSSQGGRGQTPPRGPPAPPSPPKAPQRCGGGRVFNAIFHQTQPIFALQEGGPPCSPPRPSRAAPAPNPAGLRFLYPPQKNPTTPLPPPHAWMQHRPCSLPLPHPPPPPWPRFWASFEAFGKSAKPREREEATEEGRGRERGKEKRGEKGEGGVQALPF